MRRLKMPINLNNAAKYYKELPHQKAAFNFLESQLSESLLDEFADIYRATPSNPQITYITPTILQKLTGYSAHLFDATFCGDYNKLLMVTGFDKHVDALCMLVANLSHETGNYMWMKEISDGRQYEWRRDLGNTQPGDGPKFKGAGALMLTGRYNYSRAAEELKDPLILERGCDYVASNYPFRSAITWIKDNDLLNICLKSGFERCCTKINGGYNGYDDRLKKYEITKKVFNVK